MDTVESLLTKNNIYYRMQGHDCVVHCLNPEHEDNNPSMRVDKLTGNFHCFSCGYAGNLFTKYNATRNEVDIRTKALRERIQSLIKTNLHIPISAKPFTLSYRNISPSTYEYFDVFTLDGDLAGRDVNSRVVVPIRDISGEIQFYIARYIHSELDPKYLITPTEAKKILWPAKVDYDNGSIIIVEGIFDVINLWDKGIKNAVCTFGIDFGMAKKLSRVRENAMKLNLFKIQGIHTIYIMYDGDTPGLEAAYKLEEKVKNNFTTEVVELPKGLDPGSMTQDDVNSLKELLQY